MNSSCFIACWLGGKKIWATRYGWIVMVCLAFAAQSHKGVVREMWWMPLLDA